MTVKKATNKIIRIQVNNQMTLIRLQKKNNTSSTIPSKKSKYSCKNYISQSANKITYLDRLLSKLFRFELLTTKFLIAISSFLIAISDFLIAISDFLITNRVIFFFASCKNYRAIQSVFFFAFQAR